MVSETLTNNFPEIESESLGTRTDSEVSVAFMVRTSVSALALEQHPNCL